MRTAIPLTVLAAALACSLATAPANARARVFVASYGNDANACTFGSPCKTFQAAINAVDAGGEVTAIDSAGFGPIDINNKSVTITSPLGIEAGIVPASGSNAININSASTDKVVLRGLTLDGAGSGLNGIAVGNVGVLEIDGCVIRNFTEHGINYGSGNTTTYALVIHNTVISLNAGQGVDIAPLGAVNVIIDNVVVTNNKLDGISVNANLATTAVVSNSVLSGSGFFGLLVQGPAKAMVSNSVVSSNGQDGLNVNGATATLRVTKTTITANPVGWAATNGALLESFGDNSLRGNTTDGTPTATVGLK